MTEPTNPADWPIEEPPDETVDPNQGMDEPSAVEEHIVENAPIAQDGSATQQVVYVAPDAVNETRPEHRDTGVVTTGSQSQSHLDTQ